jgi:hypothetical protein
VIKFTPATTAEGAGDAVKAVTFFEKKVTKKTFGPAGADNAAAEARRTEVFLPPGGPVLFLQKKKVFLTS